MSHFVALTSKHLQSNRIEDLATENRADGFDAACRVAGFRRVERIEFVFSESGATAFATGVLHRYPRTMRVSLATANRLVVAGVPVLVVDDTP